MCSGVKAAAYSGGRYLTPNESLEVFGSVISFKFYNGSGYTDAQFTYNSTVTITSPSVHSADGSYTYEGTTFLEYRASANSLSTDPSYITVDIQPTYSIFDTMQIHSVIALSDGNSTSKYLSTATYQSPAWDWMYDGTHYHIENRDESASGSGYYAYLTHSGRNFTYICADLTSQSLASGYSYRATFSGNQIPTGSYYRLLIGVPYIDSDSSAAAGTSGSGSGSVSGSGVDMGPTNTILEEQTGLLQQIKQGIQGFFDTIKNALVSVFVPSSDFMNEFKADMQDLLSDHLGGLYQAVSAIDDIFDRFGDARAKGSIHIDAVQIPLAGEYLTLGNWDVPLKQDGLSLLYDGIAFIIDFLAVAAFLNMCRNKLEIFLNPDSEVITD